MKLIERVHYYQIELENSELFVEQINKILEALRVELLNSAHEAMCRLVDKEDADVKEKESNEKLAERFEKLSDTYEQVKTKPLTFDIDSLEGLILGYNNYKAIESAYNKLIHNIKIK